MPDPSPAAPAGRRPRIGAAGGAVHGVAFLVLVALAALLVLVLAGCDAAAPARTSPISPGTLAAPREVNVIARDYAYVPATLDLVPGETVVLHVVNGGLATHEAILGDMDAQLAWEAAEAPLADAPPGPTPDIPAPAGFDGVRVVVGSGQRVDVTWTVPPDAASTSWFVGCHLPGHWEKGMVVPVRFVGADGDPIAPSRPPSMLPSPLPSS